jgi:4-amino-4-deoxy-L-arabinose transferase-like glycosyltransferase
LVLAHTSSSTAREASLVIAQQWSEIGVETSLRQLDPGISFPEDDNWDILYVEAVVQEPLVDAQRLLGAGGLAELVDATINQSLQDLAYAQTWQDACRKLRTIHRQVSNDLPVIPLYQVKEYFAFRDNVFEVGRDIIHLYENVDRWRIQSFVTEQEVAKEQP